MMTKPPVAAAPRRSLFGAAVLALCAATLSAPVRAQDHKELGRMWTFEAAPVGWFQQAYDFTPSQEWLDHARLSSLRLGRKDASRPSGYAFFCSASFVSPYGLIMTNHHCSRDAITGVQGENDWLKDGFYAGGFDGEVRLPDLVVTQMVAQRDVTKEVAASNADQVLAQAKAAQPELFHEVIGLYQGGMYQLYSFKVYDDLRLVCVPHGQSAHFGGDDDNFCFPRWGLDFSFLRAYENGVPADTAATHFTWKTEGAKEGDLVFVTGNPGRTGRLQTLAQCQYLRDNFYPQQLAGMRKMLADLYEKAKDPAQEKELRATILRYENSRKAFEGYLDGLQNPRIMAIKQKAEADLRAAVAKNPELQKKYGDAWDKIAALQDAKIAATGNRDKLTELGKQEQAEQKRIGEACFAVYGTSIPPDATMSLRISDGVVKGYRMNGTRAPYFTTLYGLFARHTEFGGVHPFDLPQAWLDKEKELDPKTPFNFVATCDIIGGNSGSPMIDKDQHVVGLIFDGNIEMLGNNYVFDDEVSRTVSVHPAIIVEALRKVYAAGLLADELEQKGRAKGLKVGMGAARAVRSVGESVTAAEAEARIAKTNADVRMIAEAVRMYRVRKGMYPSTLSVLAEKDSRGRSELDELPDDCWGTPFRLDIDEKAKTFAVVSAGPDQTFGTADDVSSASKARDF